MNDTDTQDAETEGGRTEANEREESARKAREAADRMFPGHDWIKVEDGIYLSPNRPVGKKSNYRNYKTPEYCGITVILYTLRQN